MNQNRLDFPDFHWLDVAAPTPDLLNELAQKYHLHATSMQDCLQPEHLPKYENFEDHSFVILRAYDRECNEDADTVQELTRKVAIFFSDEFLITVHRKELGSLTETFARFGQKIGTKAVITPENIIAQIFSEVVRTYDRPAIDCLKQLEMFEAEIFGQGTQRKFRLQKGYYLKRKVTVLKNMLRATIEPLVSVMEHVEAGLQPAFRNVREHIDSIFYYSDEVSDSMDSLMTLHVSLASQKTNEASHRINEVMRVLTIFSVFFLPINFIASVYGMNFDWMPELKHHYGYPIVLGLMATVVVSIFIWFQRKGWLK